MDSSSETSNVIQFKRPRGYIVIQCAILPEFEGLRQVYKAQKIESFEQYQYFENADEGLVVLLGGMGSERAYQACDFALKRWHCKTIIDFGVAGALVTGLVVGDCVFYKKNIGSHFPEYQIHGRLRSTEGKIASQDADVMTLAHRDEIARSTGAIAVTWETSAIEKFCERNNLHFFSCRMISDIDVIDTKVLRSREMLRMIRDAAEELKLHVR